MRGESGASRRLSATGRPKWRTKLLDSLYDHLTAAGIRLSIRTGGLRSLNIWKGRPLPVTVG